MKTSFTETTNVQLN